MTWPHILVIDTFIIGQYIWKQFVVLFYFRVVIFSINYSLSWCLFWSELKLQFGHKRRLKSCEIEQTLVHLSSSTFTFGFCGTLLLIRWTNCSANMAVTMFIEVSQCWCLHFVHEIGCDLSLRHRITARRMSGFVRRCVITEECPETFLPFLRQDPSFPTACPGLKKLFPFVLTLPLLPFLALSFALCLWRRYKGLCL